MPCLCCVMATDSQLKNLVRFCTNLGASCILGIDPTFNLAKFYVTVTTFTYTHVVNRKKYQNLANLFWSHVCSYWEELLIILLLFFKVIEAGAEACQYHYSGYRWLASYWKSFESSIWWENDSSSVLHPYGGQQTEWTSFTREVREGLSETYLLISWAQFLWRV